MNTEKIRNYFIYEDNLSRVVSRVSGVLIVIFNFLSGFMIIYILSNVFFGISEPGKAVIFFYFIFGIVAGAFILKINVSLFNSLLNGVEIEKYSYLRIILLLSIASYFFIMFFYTVTFAFSVIKNSISVFF